MNTEDLRNILKEHENRVTHTATIPLGEYYDMRTTIDKQGLRIDELERDIRRYQNLFKEFGLPVLTPNVVISDSIKLKYEHDPISMKTSFILRFDVDGRV